MTRKTTALALGALLWTGCGDSSAGSADGSEETTAGESADASGADDGASEDGGDACGGCDDDDPCTEDTCEASGACTYEPIIDNSCRPVITVDYPPRAATLVADEGDTSITITGKVESGLGTIVAFTLNDEEVPLDINGRFEYPVPVRYGPNVLSFATEDSEGYTRERVQSFLWSSDYRFPTSPGEGMSPLGLGIYLDQEVLDDGDPTDGTDDLATIIQAAVGSLDLSALFDSNTPIANEAGYDIYLTSLLVTTTSANLEAIDGGLRLQASLNDIIGGLVFDCTDWTCELLGGDSTGGLAISSVILDADLGISANPDGTLNVTVISVATAINSLNLYSNNGWTDFLLTIIEPFILGGVVADLEVLLNDSVGDLLGPLLADGFSALAFQTSLDLPNLGDPEAVITVELLTNFAETDFHNGVAPPDPSPPQGGAFIERGGGYPDNVVTPYENLGIPDRAGCGLAAQTLDLPRVAPLEIGLTDDLLNQILFAGWRGGLLEFPVGPDLLGDVNLDLFGITELALTLSGMLAPTASDCGAQGELVAHLGDLRIDGSMKLQGSPLTFVAYVSCDLALEVGASETGIALDVTGVSAIDSELTINEPEHFEAEPLLKSVLQNALGDALVGALAGGGLGSIPLPTIDLSEALGLPPGSALIEIQPQTATRVDGTTVIGGTF